MNTNLILICGVSLLFVFVLMIAIVFIVLQRSRKNNPSKASDVRPEPRANWLYIWLFFAPLITVPWMVATMPHPPPAYDIYNFDPAWSPDGTRIAFYSNRGGNDEIYVMNTDGSQQTRLTSSGLINSYPIWSPDGKRIIFTSASNRAGDAEIYVMKADGSEQTRLTDNGGESRAWSPDGARIAITSRSTQNGNWDIYVMNADGSQRIRLTNNGGTSPSWSPDGTQIAFVANRDGKDAIYVMKADGSQQTLLASADKYASPAWSPDGTRITFQGSDHEIYVTNADGSQQTRLTNNDLNNSYPAWSPDGTRIAFYSGPGGTPDIYVMKADGSQPTRLTSGAGGSFRWSPDGTRLAFVSGVDRDPNGDIYVVNADGSQRIRLTNNMGISSIVWSPDGTRIAFDSRVGDWDTFVINSDGSGLRMLTDSSQQPPAKPILNYVLAVLFPAMVHLVLLLGLFTSSLYIRRHTQQASALIGLRIVSSVLFIGLMSYAGGIWGTVGSLLWFLVNGSLWLFGSLLGIWQVRNGDCWLMRWRGEKDLLPRSATAPVTPVAVPSIAPTAPQVAERFVEPIAMPAPAFSVPSDPSAAFELGLVLVSQGRREQAIACFMFVFRNGSPALRQRAIAEMEKLGEVENG